MPDLRLAPSNIGLKFGISLLESARAVSTDRTGHVAGLDQQRRGRREHQERRTGEQQTQSWAKLVLRCIVLVRLQLEDTDTDKESTDNVSRPGDQRRGA